MNQHPLESRQDRPIEAEAGDQLDRGPFVDSLARALIIDDLDETGKLIGRRATGYVVGLTGRWGLGKSSVLNLLSRKLGSMDDVIVASFNPWLFKERDELVTGFFNALRGAMGRNRTEVARGLIESVDRYWGAINIAGQGVAAAVDWYGGAGTATAGWRKWAPRLSSAFIKPKPRTPNEERLALEKKIAKARCAIVVLIDELDRVEDEEVRAVAQLIKAIGDIKGISYLVAYDPERVVRALGRGEGEERRRLGELYLEKIIQHPIPLRPLFAEDTKSLLEAALTDHGVNLEAPLTESQRAILDHLIATIETPREVKRLAGAFSVLERAVRGELCPYDVLGYCWLLTKAPTIRDQIALHIDDLVSDPSEKAMSQRILSRMNNEVEPDVVRVLGESAASQKRTLELLFPRFTGIESDGGERLSRRRNLLRMLYLGNAPGMIGRADLEALWTDSNLAELENKLRRLRKDSRLDSTLDRLDDLLPSLPEAGDKTFWVGLSRALLRSDWLAGPDKARALADDAATTLYNLGSRDPKGAMRLRTSLEALMAEGDLVLAPWILRKHLFAHGLTTHSTDKRGDGVFSIQETEQIFSAELPRYRTAVMDGTALRRLPNTEAIFVIANTGAWDDELREALTTQLGSVQAISTLAGLFVPPTFIIDRATLNALFDADIVTAKVENLVADTAMPTDPWLAGSVRRLRRILAGEDPDHSTDK